MKTDIDNDPNSNSNGNGNGSVDNSNNDVYTNLIEMDTDDKKDDPVKTTTPDGGSDDDQGDDTEVDDDDEDGVVDNKSDRHRGDKYVCYDCGFRTNEVQQFSHHVRHAHEDNNKLKGEQQGDDDDDDDEDEDDEEDVEEDDDDVFECLKCDYRTKKKQYYKNHMKYRHPNRRNTTNNSQDGNGGRVGGGGGGGVRGNYKCSECPFETRWKPHLNKHYKSKHTNSEVRYFKCEQCNYKSKWKHHIKEHVMFHHSDGNIEMFKCPHCDYQTKWKYHIPQHIRFKHSNDNNIGNTGNNADITNIDLSNITAIQHTNHTINTNINSNVSNNRPILVNKPMRQLQYNRTKQQQQQQRNKNIKAVNGQVDNGETITYAHHCKECPYKTNNKSNFNIHVKNRHHKDELEVLCCTECPFQTTWKYHFKNHMKIKHGQYIQSPNTTVFRCDECNYEARWKHHIKQHKLTKHSQPKQCEVCPYKTNTEELLKLHRLTQHPYLPTNTASSNNTINYNNTRTTAVWNGNLSDHIRLLPPPPKFVPFKCHLCDFETVVQYFLDQHIKMKHGEDGGDEQTALFEQELFRRSKTAENHDPLSKYPQCVFQTVLLEDLKRRFALSDDQLTSNHHHHKNNNSDANVEHDDNDDDDGGSVDDGGKHVFLLSQFLSSIKNNYQMKQLDLVRSQIAMFNEHDVNINDGS